MFSVSYAVFVATVIGSMYTVMKIQNASSLSNTVQVCSEARELTISSSLTVKDLDLENLGFTTLCSTIS